MLANINTHARSHGGAWRIITVDPDAIVLLAHCVHAVAHVRAKVVFLQIPYGQIHLPGVRVQQRLGDYVLCAVMQFHVACENRELG